MYIAFPEKPVFLIKANLTMAWKEVGKMLSLAWESKG